jgi:pimeloyl-[acyl-carrier protein] methyl ester esterase
MAGPCQLIAMHGWAGDRRGWDPWIAAVAARGWSWQSGERGYGQLPPAMPSWQLGEQGQSGGRRVLLVHSLGLHLLPPALLAEAEAVVLLASFGRFVPEAAAGRRQRQALAAMAAQLRGETAETMLLNFYRLAADPEPVDPTTMGIGDQPLAPAGLQRLEADLKLLELCTGLPEAFPSQVPTLIVEAGRDQIVAPRSQQLLRQALPAADLLRLGQAGHCLYGTPVVPMLLSWIEGLK